MRARTKRRFSKSVLALAISQAFCSAHAAVIVVTSNGDVNQDDSVCTLREAVISANTNPAVSVSGCIAGEPGQDTIDLSAASSISISQALAIS
ncbi:MAG: CSLREA domain-containing protein, partial [Arenicella sp.]|nr:CSLREA domain-containing protein [Arenicella sp.]